jgi:4-amino-4-deoxy-L-arabinose transferase-like glycosyltransferase
VLLFAVALRWEALTIKYGLLERPTWLRTLQERTVEPIGRLRPASFGWRAEAAPYVGGDPIAYLQFARDMRHFYQAHVREPVFLFTTKIFLRLLDQQDVALSFASGFFSLLVVLATYLLGAAAFSPWVGLAAAAGMAIERDVIAWSVDGWRDEAFTAFLVLSAWALVRCHRYLSAGNAVLAGVIGAGACLTRITALSFLVPGFAWLLVAARTPRPGRRVRSAALAAVTTAIITAPYLINCAIAYGDPLYAINYHTKFYTAREGGDPQTAGSAFDYVGGRLLNRPIRYGEIMVVGLTSYPFGNKWSGFDHWLPGLGRVLSWAALIGLPLFLWSGTGRLLLMLLLASLLPYAFTWPVPGGAEWRFTLHAYPFFLIAAAAIPVNLAGFARAWRGRPAGEFPASRRTIAAWTAVSIVLPLALWGMLTVLPNLSVMEALRAGDPVTISAGPRDNTFFVEGWHPAVEMGNVVTARFSDGMASAIRLPLPQRRDYHLILRLDPLWYESAPDQTVSLFLNGTAIGKLRLTWNPERVGQYEVRLPERAVRRGVNRLDFVAGHATSPAAAGTEIEGLDPGAITAFRVWYLRLWPE